MGDRGRCLGQQLLDPLAEEGGRGRAGDRDVGGWRRWEPLAAFLPALGEIVVIKDNKEEPGVCMGSFRCCFLLYLCSFPAINILKQLHTLTIPAASLWAPPSLLLVAS